MSWNLHRLLAGATAALIGSAAVAASSAQAASGLPKVPSDLFAPASYLKIRPSYIGYTGDGTGVLSGSRARSRSGGLRWSTWTASQAVGTGENQLDNCRPDCAGGHFSLYPVRLIAWRPATLHGERVFTRLTIFYTGRRPAGSSAHYTFTDLYQNRGWGFGPPDSDGYCTHTMGQPPAAGCQNITALPPAGA